MEVNPVQFFSILTMLWDSIGDYIPFCSLQKESDIITLQWFPLNLSQPSYLGQCPSPVLLHINGFGTLGEKMLRKGLILGGGWGWEAVWRDKFKHHRPSFLCSKTVPFKGAFKRRMGLEAKSTHRCRPISFSKIHIALWVLVGSNRRLLSFYCSYEPFCQMDQHGYPISNNGTKTDDFPFLTGVQLN